MCLVKYLIVDAPGAGAGVAVEGAAAASVLGGMNLSASSSYHFVFSTEVTIYSGASQQS